MKILLHSHFPAGHNWPMHALAQSLYQADHEVVWLTHSSLEHHVTSTGAKFVATQDIATLDAPLMASSTTGLLDRSYGRLKSRVLAQVSDYRRVLANFEADVLLVDVMPYGARVLYELGEGPIWATMGVIPMYLSSANAPMASSGGMPPTFKLQLFWNWLKQAFERWVVTPCLLKPILDRQRCALGLGSLPYGERSECFTYSPHLHIQASSPTLEFRQLPEMQPYRLNTHFVGPLITKLSVNSHRIYMRTMPPWWDEVVAHPRVIGITQGTLTTDPESLIRPAIEALASDGSLLLLVTSPHEEELKARYAKHRNVRVHGWLHYDVLLPQLSVLITNGGYGSITQALSHKVPLICAGQTEDKKDTAARVAWAQGGIDLKTDNPSAKSIRDAVGQILYGEVDYKERAAQLGDELNMLGGARKARQLLEKLVKREQEARPVI